MNDSYFPANLPKLILVVNARKSSFFFFFSWQSLLVEDQLLISVNRAGLDSSREIHCTGKACQDARTKTLGKTLGRKMKIQRWRCVLAARMSVFAWAMIQSLVTMCTTMPLPSVMSIYDPSGSHHINCVILLTFGISSLNSGLTLNSPISLEGAVRNTPG